LSAHLRPHLLGNVLFSLISISISHLFLSLSLSPHISNSASLGPIILLFSALWNSHLLDSAHSSPILSSFQGISSQILSLDKLHFFIWAGCPLQYDHFKNLSFFTWTGHPLQFDHFGKTFVFFHLGRSSITIRPF
jgi:hypothetical protein